MYSFKVQTKIKSELINITNKVEEFVKTSGKEEGIVTIFTPHTTAGITINENADPDVKKDILRGLDIISPNRPVYNHFENNSDAHIKSSLVGVSETLILNNSKLVLGIWQDIYFCEFDGPKTRTIYVQIT